MFFVDAHAFDVDGDKEAMRKGGRDFQDFRFCSDADADTVVGAYIDADVDADADTDAVDIDADADAVDIDADAEAGKQRGERVGRILRSCFGPHFRPSLN